jgi:hypothetical protein
MYVSVPFRSSTFLSDVKVDIANGKAVAYFQDGSVYGYRNVSKRAIANILTNPSISLGFWCNRNLFQSNRAREDWRVIPKDKNTSEGYYYLDLPKSKKTHKDVQLPNFV